jgi:hypothetical protein
VKLPFTNNEGKLKAQESKPKTKTETQAEENLKLFLNSEFLKSRSPFTSVGPSPFIGRQADFLYTEITLV